MASKYEKALKNYDLHCKRIAQATFINIVEKPDEKELRIKLLEKEYTSWFEYYFPNYAKAKCASFHKKTANKIISNPVIFMLLNWFRGSAKSVHICMGIPLFLMVTDRLKFMLLVGQTEKKALKLLSGIQAQLKYNHRFINDYGKQFNFGDWSEGNFATKDGVRFMALGFGQDPRGLREGADRPDYIVADDIDNLKRCNNNVIMAEGEEYITSDLWGCFDSQGHRRFIFANNKIHKNSLMARLIREFAMLNKKAEEKGFTKKHFHSEVHIKDKTGKSSWPEKNSDAQCDEIIAERPYRSAQREYFCNPIQDGKIFKNEQIQYKTRLQLRKYDALCVYGDLSYKDQGDFKALVFLGKTGRELHIIDCYVRQGSRRMAAIWLYDLYEKMNLQKFNVQYLIEGLFAQDEFVNDFDLEGDARNYHIPVVADKKNKANKFDRIEAKAGYFERRNVWFHLSLKDMPDTENLVNQLLAFEKGSGAADDGPDALCSAIDNLERAAFIHHFDPRIGTRKPLSTTF